MKRLLESVFGSSAIRSPGETPAIHSHSQSPEAHVVAGPVPCSPLTAINPDDIVRLMELPKATRLQEFEKLEATVRAQCAQARKEVMAALKTIETAEAEFKKLRRVVRQQP
jgi:hypothetical protein